MNFINVVISIAVLVIVVLLAVWLFNRVDDDGERDRGLGVQVTQV